MIILNNFVFKFIFVLFLFYFNIINLKAFENKIIFKILNKSFTNVDIENRKKYLLFVGDNYGLQENEILQDFISVNLFNEYYTRMNLDDNFDSKVGEIYEDILINKTNIDTNNIDKPNIIYNLRLDLIRKSVLENLLNTKKNEIFEISSEEDIIYDYSIEYINIYLSDLLIYREELENIKIKNILEISDFLNKKNIPYFTITKEINNINKINKTIKDNIFKNNNFFMIEKNNLITFVNITKQFETYDGLKADIFRIESKEKIPQKKLNCNNFNDLYDIKIDNKEYFYEKLNNNIKQNLLNINDYIEFKSENNFTYVVLCDLKYDKELFNNIHINEKINSSVKLLENNFIKKYSNEYNLIFINE